jgi:putative ABC transport system permease protein
MSTSSAPSTSAERLLSLVVRDPEHRESVLGDLREEHVRLARRIGAAKATAWHRRQSIDIAIRYGFARLLRRKPPTRWITLAMQDTDGRRWSGGTRDLLYAWRAIGQRPGLSAVIVVTLATALAANSTTYSLMDAIVLRPYRFAGIDRLLVITTMAPDDTFVDRENVTAADFREWREQSRTIKDWAVYQWWDTNLSGVDIPEQVAGFRVSPGYFALLGVTPALGREFITAETEQGQHRRVVLGHALWTRRFAADPQIVGKTVRFDGEPYEVVGVGPAGFNIPDGAEVWAPLALTDRQWQDRRAANYNVFARLADRETVERARAEITAIMDVQRRDHPDTNSTRFPRVLAFTQGMADPGAGPFIAIWQAAAILLLLIACANIANLLMARGAERSAEYSLRLALGASRTRLFGQTLLEGLLLAALAVILSMPLLAVGLGLSRASIPPSVIRFLPGWQFIAVDARLFTLTALLGTAAMLLFSLVPALQAVGSQVAESLRQAGRTLTASRRRQWLRNTLATTQMALALALLFASTLALTAADRTVNGVLGFDKRNVLVGQLTLPARTYENADKRRQFATSVIDQLQGIPAVSDVGMTSHIPAGFGGNARRVWPEGVTITEAEARWADYRRVTSGYFGALRIPLLRGRWLDDNDRADSTMVAVVSSAMARRYWSDQDPIGKRFRITADGPWITIVGVSGDVVHNWFTRQDETIYRPISQDAPYTMAFAIRTFGDPTAIGGNLRRAVAATDSDQPIAMLTPLDHLVEERAAGLTFIARALGVVALIALVLSIMGIYSLMAYVTAQRTQEIGVRMALGAGRWQVVRAMTRRALVITLAGTIVGAALAFGLGRTMQAMLAGLVTTNVGQLIAIVVLLAAAALLAAYLPARRASRIDPMNALREV